MLLINHPDVVNYIDKIVLMGGSIGMGNNGAAEFNILVDPEAASLVFDCGLPIYMIPLEITHTATVTPTVLSRIETLNSRFSKIMASFLKYYRNTVLKKMKQNDPPLHDPCATALLIDPTLFEYRLMRVDVETSSLLSAGQTICDIYDYSNKKKNVHVGLKMDVEKFWDLMIDALQKANQNSPANF